MSRFDRYLQNSNIQGALAAIRHGEGTSGERGYTTMFTGAQFDASKGWQHPRAIQKGGGYSSDAAGAYQYLSTTWDEVARAEGLKDFSPINQDRGALALIEQRGVNLDQLAKTGLDVDTIDKLAPVWASLPTKKTGTSYYGQGGKSFDELLKVAGRGDHKPSRGAPRDGGGSGAGSAGGVTAPTLPDADPTASGLPSPPSAASPIDLDGDGGMELLQQSLKRLQATGEQLVKMSAAPMPSMVQVPVQAQQAIRRSRDTQQGQGQRFAGLELLAQVFD